MCVGRPIPYTSVRLVDDAGAEVVAPDTVGHLLIKGDNVTRGYLRQSRGQRRRDRARTAGCAPAISRSSTRASTTSPAARRKSSSSTARTTTRTTSRQCCRPSRGSSSARSSPRARAAPARRPTSSCCSCCIVATWPTSCRSRRVPRTGQRARGCRGRARRARHAHAEDDERQAAAHRARRSPTSTGEFAPEIAEFDRAWAAVHGHGRVAAGQVEQTAQGDRRRRAARQARRRRRQPVRRRRELAHADPDPREDRRAGPGPVDLTELFDFPTISQLATAPRGEARAGLGGAHVARPGRRSFQRRCDHHQPAGSRGSRVRARAHSAR